jgi:hypothetical protein
MKSQLEQLSWEIHKIIGKEAVKNVISYTIHWFSWLFQMLPNKFDMVKEHSIITKILACIVDIR